MTIATLDRPPVAAPESKRQFLRSEALAIADKFIEFLDPHSRRCVVAGSIRRSRPEVGDIEILFIPKLATVVDPSDLFGAKKQVSAADLALDALLRAGVIAKRPNVNGGFTWGAENKLAVHVESGIPVDFFATDEERFWNALFVRTGPKALNQAVAARAIERGWRWHAYGDGFTRGDRERKRVKSEHDVFNHVDLPYQEPWER